MCRFVPEDFQKCNDRQRYLEVRSIKAGECEVDLGKMHTTISHLISQSWGSASGFRTLRTAVNKSLLVS